jgi:hypothetical protein
MFECVLYEFEVAIRIRHPTTINTGVQNVNSFHVYQLSKVVIMEKLILVGHMFV